MLLSPGSVTQLSSKLLSSQSSSTSLPANRLFSCHQTNGDIQEWTPATTVSPTHASGPTSRDTIPMLLTNARLPDVMLVSSAPD